ncbi:hypothetical protein TNCV_1374881 [Trichonephila clavipes]|nr:hypothetical protein TNCV_1374881 [Trichonephila clavipes]
MPLGPSTRFLPLLRVDKAKISLSAITLTHRAIVIWEEFNRPRTGVGFGESNMKEPWKFEGGVLYEDLTGTIWLSGGKFFYGVGDAIG